MQFVTRTGLGCLLLLALSVPHLHGQQVSASERERFEQIRAKHQRGVTITPEEIEFAKSIQFRMNQNRPGQDQQLPPNLSDADRKRFEQIRGKHQRGETITPEEMEFVKPILARMNQTAPARISSRHETSATPTGSGSSRSAPSVSAARRSRPRRRSSRNRSWCGCANETGLSR